MIQTIYKKDTKGKLRFLTIETQGATLFQRSGVIGTESPLNHSKVCKGKNVGRSNETSPEAQAEIEAKAMVVIKLSEDYYETPEAAEGGEKIFPMLAKDWDKEKKKVKYPLNAQRKYDGMRCLTVIEDGQPVQQLSRDGKVITTMQHIANELRDAFKGYPDCILDGELYAHGLSFQENMRLIKKQRPESVNVKYHVYDVVLDRGFVERQLFLVSLPLSRLFFTDRVGTFRVDNEEELNALHSQFLTEGYEGTMVRHGSDGYKLNGRSSSLLKKKDFDDVALPLLDVVAGEQRPEWGVPVLELEGKRFQAGTKLSHEGRIDLLANKDKYIGKTTEIRYFGVSEDGVPRFPVMVGFRLDK